MNRLRWHRHLLSRLVALALFALALWTIPHRWCARDAQRWYHGEAALQQQLVRGLERQLATPLDRGSFRTGSAQFDGEWLFGTYQMAMLGLGQAALEHPEWRSQHVALMNRCVERLLSPEVRAFDREMWRNDPLDTLQTNAHHAAFLGYFNIALGLLRQLDPQTPHAALHNRITATLVRRIEASPTLLLQSYPNEVYPVDNCAVIGSIGLDSRVTGTDRRALLERWSAQCRQRYIHQPTGLLYQCVHPETGEPADEPRGSGTTLGLYFLSFADPQLSRELYQAARTHLADTLFGFGVVREYCRGYSGSGDIDSGPIILGYSISATGFLIAGSRMFDDPEQFRRLTSMAHLFGAPLVRDGRREYVTGGPLGNAIMLAMLTAQKPVTPPGATR